MRTPQAFIQPKRVPDKKFNALNAGRAERDRKFLDNYREITKDLADSARSSDPKDIQRGTLMYNIMERIKLPTYFDSLTDKQKQDWMYSFGSDPTKAEQDFNKLAQEWDEDNFYYKLRAAQYLKDKPAEYREKVLDDFTRDKYLAKDFLDGELIIDEQNKDRAKAAGAAAVKGVADAASAIGNAIGSLFQKKGNN